MVSCVLFTQDTKCKVLVGLSWCLVYCLLQIQSVRYLVGLSWCLVSCLLQIQSVRYWLVSHGVLWLVSPDTKCEVLVGSHGVLCIVCSRYKV